MLWVICSIEKKTTVKDYKPYYWSTEMGWTRHLSEATTYTNEEKENNFAAFLAPAGPSSERVWSKVRGR